MICSGLMHCLAISFSPDTYQSRHRFFCSVGDVFESCSLDRVMVDDADELLQLRFCGWV